MVVIRLSRVGKKNSPAYRVVVADKQRAAKRKYIEVIGHYNPTQKPKVLEIDKDRALLWISNGAKPSDTVNNLMVDLGIMKKSEKINKVYGKAQKKKAAKDGGATAESKSAETETVSETSNEAALDSDKKETDEPQEKKELDSEMSTDKQDEPSKKTADDK